MNLQNLLFGISITASVAASLLGTCALPCHATQYQPNTSVAILPIADNSGEKDAGFVKRLSDKAMTEIKNEFTAHGFRVMDDATVAEAVHTSQLDMTDNENWTKANLYKIGETANSDIVVFAVLTGTGQAQHVNFWDETKEGWTQIQFWAVDVKQHTPILSAKNFRGSSKHHEFGLDLTSGKDFELTAAENAVRDAFKDFFESSAPTNSAPTR